MSSGDTNAINLINTGFQAGVTKHSDMEAVSTALLALAFRFAWCRTSSGTGRRDGFILKPAHEQVGPNTFARNGDTIFAHKDNKPAAHSLARLPARDLPARSWSDATAIICWFRFP